MFSSLFSSSNKKANTNFKIKGDGSYAGYPVLDILFKHSTKDISNTKISEIGNIISRVNWNLSMPMILNLHGHDPVLHWESIINILSNRKLIHISHAIIETTGAAPIEEDFISALNAWIFHPVKHLDVERKIIWSNNPKLSSTQHKGLLDIKPQNVLLQRGILGHDRFEQYFKFSCPAQRSEFVEVQAIMHQYHDAGIPQSSKVFIVPQKGHNKKCASLCLEYGFIFSNSADLDEPDNATVV